MVSNTGFAAFGFSSKMGPQLRQVVEQQLRNDLLHYGVKSDDLHFDWSHSCIEGHDAAWLDGHIENFSGIALLDSTGKTVVDGWMEFILTNGLLLIYWDNLTSWDTAGEHLHKKQFGIPPHIWNQIPTSNQPNYATERMRNSPFDLV